MSIAMTETRRLNAPKAARPRRTRRGGRRYAAATRPSTASSSSPSGPPASIAGRAAPRGRRSARMSSFFATAAAAERAGYRACKRCRPDKLGARRSARSRRSGGRASGSTQAEEAPKLADLAASAGLSPFHFHRLFKEVTGVTPKAYAAQMQARRAADSLRTAGTVTEAIYDAGFNSSSRFYETAAARLGMTPSAVRRGGEGAEIRFAVGECSLGAVLVAATDKGVCAIMLGDDPDAWSRDLQDRFPRAELGRRRRRVRALVARVVGLVEAPGSGLDLPLDIRGTAFQQRVWAGAARHPAGQDGELCRDRAGDRPARRRCARSRRPAPPIRSRSRSPATGWCARTASSPAIAGASSASAR